MDDKIDENQIVDLDPNFDETKRKSLIKIGQRAVYITPAVLTLLTSQKASAMSVGGGKVGKGKGGKGKGKGKG